MPPKESDGKASPRIPSKGKEENTSPEVSWLWVKDRKQKSSSCKLPLKPARENDKMYSFQQMGMGQN